eukprot:CAMPEP_0118883440 /NCGR_PEP_ID=MMETSP1163-20130328/22507_1 /TAXON_ID=124430 /ORGANISM="Phaeomonas parva, Strain CCMP2877" /LENGTH=37 /DNA_ID= /DNA_START= /DNA_END= /DNA_ORIENTATION=
MQQGSHPAPAATLGNHKPMEAFNAVAMPLVYVSYGAT